MNKYNPEKTDFLLFQPRQTALEELMAVQMWSAKLEIDRLTRLLAQAETAHWSDVTGAIELANQQAVVASEPRRRVGGPDDITEDTEL